MAAATVTAAFPPQVKISSAGHYCSEDTSNLCHVSYFHWNPRTQFQGLQSSASLCPVTASPSVRAASTVRAFQPVTEVRTTDKLVQDEELPSSAMAIAAAVGTSFTVVGKTVDSKHAHSAPSAEFLALCAEQLTLCDDIVGHNAKLTVYIRPAECYSTGQLEFHCIAVYPSQQEELPVLKQSDADASIALAETALITQEAVEVASGTGAVVLPMVKDLFLIGLLVVEARGVKSGKLKPVRPMWPPKKVSTKQADVLATSSHALGSSTTASTLSRNQLTEIVKIARSLALACVLDQRALLLQKSIWQKGAQIDSLLEQAQGPLQAMRTLGQLLLPQLKRGEISRDVVEDMLVQGTRMKDVLQQLHNVSQDGQNLVHYSGDLQEPPESLHMWPHSVGESADTGRRQQGLLPSAYMKGKDVEAPMPPLALAPLPSHDISRPCDVAEILRQLGRAANGLANQRHQTLQITSSSPLWAAVDTVSLRRACSHLLDRALQHTPTGGWVRTDAMQAPGGGVLVVFEDNGPDLAMQARGLAPKWRGTDLGSDEKHGLGSNGMAFVREIVELQLGGVLRVQSPHLLNAPPGAGGTHVEIWLPVAFVSQENLSSL